MSWPEAIVLVASIAGAVAALWVVMPYMRTRTEEQRREAALKAANERIDKLESVLAERRMPSALGRRTA